MKKRIVSLLLVAACAFCVLVPSAGAIPADKMSPQEYEALREIIPELPEEPYTFICLDERYADYTEFELACIANEYEESIVYSTRDIVYDSCPVCKSAKVFWVYGPVNKVLVSSADGCYYTKQTASLYCLQCSHHILDRNYIGSVVTAHSWGGLNDDGYTHSCTICGYTDRA